MTYTLLCILLGLLAGFVSGLNGIGGGVIIVPALIFLLGLSQHEAQGTTLALLVPPIGLLGAWTYYRQGFVDIKIAACICLGFLVGSLLGAKLATDLPTEVLSRVFGSAMLMIALRMIW
jgi:uncharacterized membrane protein YfcA